MERGKIAFAGFEPPWLRCLFAPPNGLCALIPTCGDPHAPPFSISFLHQLSRFFPPERSQLPLLPQRKDSGLSAGTLPSSIFPIAPLPAYFSLPVGSFLTPSEHPFQGMAVLPHFGARPRAFVSKPWNRFTSMSWPHLFLDHRAASWGFLLTAKTCFGGSENNLSSRVTNLLCPLSSDPPPLRLRFGLLTREYPSQPFLCAEALSAGANYRSSENLALVVPSRFFPPSNLLANGFCPAAARSP